MKPPRLVSLSVAIALLLTGLNVNAQQLDAGQLLQMMQQRSGVQQQQTSPSQGVQLQRVSEVQLAQQLAAWPAASGPFVVESFRDGFSIEGRRVLDPEGRIIQFAVDQATGDAAYLVEVMPGQHQIKVMRHKVGVPIVVAVAMRQWGQWSVETVTGVRVNGSKLSLNSQGFIIARDGATFRYAPGRGLQSFGLPDTYSLAALQNGNVAATGWLLLEKRPQSKQEEGGLLAKTSLGGLFNAVKAVGAAAGINKSDSDFALLNIESGKTVPIGISLGEKETQLMSQCHQRNAWIALCDRSESIESLYGQNGLVNRGHYFWRVSWFNTKAGVIAVVMEDGIGKIDAVHLDSGRRVTVFERTLGIGDWSTVQAPDGRIQVKAKLGFESAVNDDVARLFGSDGQLAGR